MNVKNISRFDSLRDTQPQPFSWQALWEETVGERHAAATRHYRDHIANEPAVKAPGDDEALERWKAVKHQLKSNQPGVIVSVTLAGGRSNACVTGYLPHIMVDIDGVPYERFGDCLAKVRRDSHSFFVQTTISGRGIRVFCKVEGEISRQNFGRVWQTVNDYYARLCDIPIDRQCKNATRMSVISHDPEARLNEQASPFRVEDLMEQDKTKPKTRKAPSPARAFKVIAARLDEEGIEYRPGSYNEYASQTFYRMNRYGVPKDDARNWATRQFPDYDAAQLMSIVESCYADTDRHGSERLPKPSSGAESKSKTSVTEMEAFIGQYMEIRLNELTHQIEMRLKDAEAWERLTDHRENSLWCAMQRAGMEVKIGELHTLLTSDFVKSYHPLKHYLENLPEWDGVTDYIGQFASMVHVKPSKSESSSSSLSSSESKSDSSPNLWSDAFKRWLVAMIASALDESVVNQVILVLIGRQGCYKTSFMQHLLPPELGEYYVTKANSQRMTKDDLFTMTENLVINCEEIGTMPQAELNQLKAMVTQRYVDERPAYGRNKVHLPHVASFVATGNDLQFLTDDTGNRRWLPFEVVGIDNPWEVEINYRGIYSQAYALVRQKFRYWFTDEEVQALQPHMRRFEVPKPEYELILMYFRKPREIEKAKYMTASQIALKFSSAAIRMNLTRIGRALRELGFEQIHTEKGNLWLVAERNVDDVSNVLPEACLPCKAEESASAEGFEGSEGLLF